MISQKCGKQVMEHGPGYFRVKLFSFSESMRQADWPRGRQGRGQNREAGVRRQDGEEADKEIGREAGKEAGK